MQMEKQGAQAFVQGVAVMGTKMQEQNNASKTKDTLSCPLPPHLYQ
jgi:hypothetical protein